MSQDEVRVDPFRRLLDGEMRRLRDAGASVAVRFAGSFFWLLALLLAMDLVGFSGPGVGRILLFLVLLLPWAVCLPSPDKGLRRSGAVAVSAGIALLPIAAIGFPRTSVVEFHLAGVALVVWGFSLRARDPRLRVLFQGFAVSTIFVSTLHAFYLRSPRVWHVVTGASEILSGRVSEGVVSHAVPLGPSASGIWVLAAAVVVVLFLALHGGRRRVLALSLGALCLGLFYVGMHVLLGLLYSRTDLLRSEPGGVAFHAQLVLVPALAILFVFLAPRPGAPRGRAAWIFTGAAAIALGAAGLLIPGGEETVETRPRPTVAIVTGGAGDFGAPRADAYGIERIGMYGLLEPALEDGGYRPVRRERPFTPEKLAGVDAAILLLPTRAFTSFEKRAVWRHVESGGGLWVLGDHTDLLGSMGPLNDLLVPAGVRFRFDTAMELRSQWYGCYEVYPHPANAGMERDFSFQFGHGASLQIKPPAAPLLVGKKAFSDLGNVLNTGRGAFLGDYRYQLGERMGDCVLAAHARVGKGRVVVFGDTSSLQNITLPYSRAWVLRNLAWLTRAPSEPSPSPPIGSVIAALASVFVLALFRAPAAGVVPLFLLAPIAWKDLDLARAEPHPLAKEARIARIDTRYQPRFALDFFEDGSVNGLCANLARAGFSARVGDVRPSELGPTDRLVVFVAPARPFREADIDALERFAREGGILFVSTGYEESGPVAPLLTRFGLGVGEVPLGAAPILSVEERLKYEGPRFAEAWPVLWKRTARDIVFYEWEGHPIFVFRPLGKGGCLLMADSWFLTDKHLESEEMPVLPNIKLLEKVFRVLRERGYLRP